MATFWCSGCRKDRNEREFGELLRDRPRRVRSRCRTCRREDRYARLWPETCDLCQLHRRLDANHQCKRCNAAAGLRQCRTCGELKAALLDFWEKKASCKACLK